MRYLKIIILLVIISVLFNSCSNLLLIESSESFITKNNAKKIICIDPRFYFEEYALNYDLIEINNITHNLKKDILSFSKKNKVNVELLDLNNKTTNNYYEDLLKLKNNMLEVNFNQRTPLNYDNTVETNKIQQKVFVYPPKIAHEFNSLSKIYGTPYFSFIGIYFVKGKIVLYHVVVNTDEAETVYREYRSIDKKLNKDVIAQMIYDSYTMLAKQIKKTNPNV